MYLKYGTKYMPENKPRRKKKMYAVELHNLSKTYPGGKQAVQNVSLELEPGEVFGFLGPNGAGKTTTVKLLNGMLTPTEGICRVLGSDPALEPEKVHAVSGVVTEHARMYENLTGLENLVFYAELYGISADEAARRSESLLKEMELEEAKDRKLAAWSTGMRQRLSLARALIHRPKILFLDEPTSGLDPESAQNVNRMIREMAENSGITVFLCTHQLRYAQEICTRYGLIEEGRLLAEGTLDELRSETFSRITLQIRAGSMPPEMGFRQTGAQEYEASIRSEDEIPEIVRRIAAAGGDIYKVEARQPDLEDIYFALTAAGREEM
jgi:ABC-2 type transport system ATP-binding protein